MSHIVSRYGLSIYKFWSWIKTLLIFWKLLLWSMNKGQLIAAIILSKLPYIWDILEELFKRILFFFRRTYFHPSHLNWIDNFVNQISFNSRESIFSFGAIFFSHRCSCYLDLIAIVPVLQSLVDIGSWSYSLNKLYLFIS